MTYSRIFKTICPLAATAALAMAQTPPAAPAPPAAPRAYAARAADYLDQAPTPPVPPAAPVPAPAAIAPVAPMAPMPPMPAMAPMPPMPPMEFDLDAPMAMALKARENFELDFDLQDQIQRAKEIAQSFKFDADEMRSKAFAMADSARMNLAFAPQVGSGQGIGYGGPKPMPAPAAMRKLTNMGDDRLYSSGQSALDNRQWDQALGYFSEVVTRNSPRADGALYWKAYALGKLGKRDEGLAAIAELRSRFASSRWLDDAKALELELKQASGQNVSPESESDEELKLMAINGLMQSDPERAMPLLERQLKGSASPRVKRNALFVLAQSNSPKAQTMIEQIARGGANPDLQVKAITYMTERRRAGNSQILSEIYASTSDLAVKRAVLQAYMNNRDKDRLLQAAKTEKAPELREIAYSYLGEAQGNPELWQLYQAETTPEGKILLLRYMHSNSNADKLLEVVRNEKDPKVRMAAMQALGSQRPGLVSAEALVTVYNAEQDQQMKQRILDSLMSQRNAKALVEIARGEKDQKMKLRIVERLANMKDKEAQDYLQEILSK
uniref:PBS lyase HEAT domain protein repeat-containing protein n=1 Tax=Solibacter usitatus (strain Ellin6076) TaxID=234267 RepID=Q01QB4_SOLUE